ncbi:MAG: hypothetical protein R3F14_17885 [Polyangiaceae bacterium]
METRASERPPAVVLSFNGTGLATVRCLARGGIRVHAAMFRTLPEGREIRFSRCCRVIELGFPPDDEETLRGWLQSFARSLGRRPVVLPTSDATALFLARQRPALEDACTTSETSYDELLRIVRKDQLYRAAEAAGVRIPPMLVEPAPDEVAAWCRNNPPPYLVKPFCGAVRGCALRTKNRTFHAAADLVRFASTTSMRKLIVQRRIDCGDGRVYDAYGLCDRRGEVLALASHRRIRQYAPGTGATSFGEIPILGDAGLEREIFRSTRTLLSRLRHHGIFGIEWLHEKRTGALYLTDFNARPFLSIGHLADAGLNLPLLAYRELIGEPLDAAALSPSLAHCYWTDFNRDLRSFHAGFRDHGQTWGDLVSSILACRSFAYFDARDPGPWLCRTLDLAKTLIR